MRLLPTDLLSEQLKPLESDVAVLADDDVIVKRNAERLGGLGDELRHLDIGARRRRVAGGMVVDEDQRSGGKLQCAFDHLARIDGRVVDCSLLLHLVGDQRVAFVQKKDAELLLRLMQWLPG